VTVAPARTSIDRETRELLAGLTARPWGQVSPSVYETARLVSLAPWLPLHAERVRFLLAAQRPDGGWGPPGGYALVPTLSATEALLATGDRGAAGRGLAMLSRLLRTAPSIADTPAADLIVPALLERIRERAGPSLPMPAGMDEGRLAAVRARFGSPAAVPQKLLHALEVLGDAARGAGGDGAARPGPVGASPAATAAWLGGPRRSPALAYLLDAARRDGGPVPCATPITVFERAWVLAGLTRAGVPLAVPAGLVASLTADWGPAGTPAGPGLPADADTTAVVLFTLLELGHPADPGVLLGYDTGEHFCTWPGEDGASVTTNAHVLDAFGAAARPGDAAVVDRLTAWLCARQDPAGWWHDRWHSSPYYATACCALALARFGRGPAAAAALARAAGWVAATQHPDGSWGHWAGTAEETAYALQVLLAPGGPARPGRGLRSPGVDLRAAVRHLTGAAVADPPLWHDKDLYAPHAIVRAAVLAARQLTIRAATA
jgi:halimadienyl-diphosphate synthase